MRAALYLASLDNNHDYTSINKISEKLDLSRHFLTKILQQLTAANLLQSFKGPNGGVKLARAGSEISLMEIVTAIDGPGLFTECVLGLPGCGNEKPCPIHDQWAETRGDLREMFSNTSLSDLAQKGKSGNLRITSAGDFTWE